MFSSLVASFILVASISAAPIVTPTLPYNVAMPGATPAYASIPLPDLLPQSSWIKLIGATTGSDKFTTLLAKRQLSLKTLTGATVGIKCLDGSFSEQDVNSLFAAGGAGTTVLLCPSAVITVLNPIQLSAQRQTLTTLGSPTGSTRATVRVMGATQTAAIVASCGDCHFGAIRNIQVDGSRPLLGQQSAFQSALIQVGGNALNQVVDSVRAFEPRGWSCLHGIEGANNMCSSLTVTNNRFESAGHAPSAGMKQQRRDDGIHTANQWADGISLACKNSTVTGNTIIDATDGAIVIFGAPGSLVDSNTIIAETRNTMGGINMIDMGPHAGSYVGTQVSNNKLIANNAFIKSGISLGVMVWGSVDYGRAFGGSVINNTFSSGPNGYFSYGVSVAGFNGARVSGSKFINTKFAGIRSDTCPRATPTPGPLVFDPATSPDASLFALPSNSTAGQWQSTPIMFVICNQPGGNATTFSN